MRCNRPVRQADRSEAGYLLVWVVFLLVVFTIALSVAVPRAAKEIQRDREVETVNRGKQYIRAIQLYYRKFHAFPPNANALVNTNEIRFLRKKYVDPMTGKDDWKPIRFGEAKTQATGFFGQPITGAGSAGGTVLEGVGPSGSGGLGGLGSPSMGSGNGGSGFGGSTFGGSSIFSPPSTGGPGTSPGAGPAGSGGTSGPGGTTGTSGATGTSGGSSAFGNSNQTFGGAGIVGFSPASTKTSILIVRKKQHYNEWEFVYEPLTDTRVQSGNTGTVGQPASSTSTPVGSSGFGSGFGGGSGSGFGSGSSGSPSPGSGSGTAPSQPPVPPGPPETPVPPQ